MPAISMSWRSSLMLKRSVSASLSASTPAPPERIRVPSITKRRRRCCILDFRFSIVDWQSALSLAALLIENPKSRIENGSRRAHEEHDDHAAEKRQQRDGGDSEDDKTRRIARCRS